MTSRNMVKKIFKLNFLDKIHSTNMIMMEKVFYSHGYFCASHPWEVIVFTLTLTISILCMGNQQNNNVCVWSKNCTTSDFDKNAYIILMTIIRCMAVLFINHQFRKLFKLGSKYLLGIALLFTVFSSFVFSSSVINFLQGDFAELNEALPVFLLLIDIPKASLLAQFALRSSNQNEVRDNIARGMSMLGPTITLDTVVQTLVIGVGPLSGVKRLEVMCCFACLSVVVNYLIFMTFFPACLSLILELSRDVNMWQITSFAQSLQEDEQKPNLILLRVKLIMAAGLSVVHLHSRWPIMAELHSNPEVPPSEHNNSYTNEDSSLVRWCSVKTDQAVILILVIALTIKHIFFESYNNEELILPNCSENQDMSSATTCSSFSTASNGERKSFFEAKFTQTFMENGFNGIAEQENFSVLPTEPRSIEECLIVLKTVGGSALTDSEIFSLLISKHISSYRLESILKDAKRAVSLRRSYLYTKLENENALQKIPYLHYNFCGVTGICCENIIGYTPIPLGVAGPLLMNGNSYFVPMATTEGCLVASTNRGCRALMLSGGVKCYVRDDFMTRGPVVRFPSTERLKEIENWLQQNENFAYIKAIFDSTSRFARLLRLKTAAVGLELFIRFEAFTGDAMGMNMLSKGSELALEKLNEIFPDMMIISLSGNYCTDKKSAAINWIDGRGKNVKCDAIVPASVVEEVLKTSVTALVDVHRSKNLVGSALAGSIGGCNAQAANIVAAIFIATGQDPAQTITSASCLTTLEQNEDNLFVSVTMPCLEVGTVGGGTSLPAQAACLEMLGVRGGCFEDPGQNAKTLACVIGGTVLAGELSLMAALSAGHLVDSHMKHNRASNIKQN